MRSVVHRLGGIIIALNLIAAPTVASGQVLHHFATTDGGPPAGELTAGRDGNLYGTTATGGAEGHGTLFRVNPASSGFQVVYSFTGTDPDGAEPSGAALVEGADGFFYGTTRSGGEFGSGTLFRFITPLIVETIFSFPADQADPRGGVILASDGRLYGTTGGGTAGFGLVYRINIDGTGFQVLKEFAGAADGGTPVAGVIEATDGFLYGTTRNSSTMDVGTVFKMSKDGGSFQTLAEINGPLGFGVTEFLDENSHILYMYGVTGEPRDLGSLNPFALSDFTFRVRADGAPISGNPYQQLYSFAFGYDVGLSPSGRLLLGSDGKLYGTTLVHSDPSEGCVNFGCGAVYRFNPAGGTPFAIHVFKELDGSRPSGGVTEGPDGRLFGLTSEGGSNGLGVLYAIADAGAIPLRVTGPASAQPGGQVTYTLRLVSPPGSQENLSGLDLLVQPSVGLTLSQSSGTFWSCMPYAPVAGAYLCGYNGIIPGGAASQVFTMTFNVSGPPLSVECGSVASPCGSFRVDMPTTSATATAFTHVVVLNPHTGLPNQAPQAADDTAKVFNTSPVVISVLDNDTDPEGDNLQLNRIIASPLYGNAVVNADGTITYTPNGTLPAADHFTYRVVDQYGASDVGTVTVTQLSGFSVHKNLIDLGVIRAGTMAAGRSMISGPSGVNGHFVFEALTPSEITAVLAGTGHSAAQALYDPAEFAADNWSTDFFAVPIYYHAVVPGRVSIVRVKFVPDGTSISLGSMVIVGEAADSATGPLHAVDDSRGAPPNTSVVIDVLANDHPLVPGTPLYTSSWWACENAVEYRFSGAPCHLVRGQLGFTPTLNGLRFFPETGFSGTTSFYYSSSDQECTNPNQPTCFYENNLYLAKVTVNVGGNAPPTVDAGPNQTVEATGPSGASVTVIGTAFDLDGDPLTFAWSGPCGTATSATATLVCPLGVHVLTLEVSDGVSAPVTATTTVTVSDTTPPSLTASADVVAEATSPAGAVVTYAAATATDAVGPVTIGYSHASGSVFPLGTTTVTVTATDGAGNFVSAWFTVTVRDTTPPVLTLPADITLTTSDPNGLAVTYTATAADLVDISVPAGCFPFSGSTFAIGATTVTCTATDDFDNTAIGSFQVTVNLLQPPQQVSVALSGNGSGTVTSAPPGVNCPGACSASFPMGSSVTLSAAAAAGSMFVGWDGICASARTGPCTFTVGGATNVTARFLLTKPVVSLKVNGQHPTPPIVTTGGPMLLTVDVSESAYTAPVSWYWALIVNGQTLWVTPSGLSPTQGPLTVAPPSAMAGATLLDVTLPAHTTVTSLFLLVDGTNTLVGGDLIVTTRP